MFAFSVETYHKNHFLKSFPIYVIIAIISGHRDSVVAIGFNYDGTLLLTGAYDGTVRIWKVETGELFIILEGPEDVEWAEWHSKGNAVIAGSKDGTGNRVVIVLFFVLNEL